MQPALKLVDRFESEMICSRASELGCDQIEQWRDLYLDCISPNIYMSPDFVLTALSTFCGDDPTIVGITTNDQLMGLGILQENSRSLRFPLPSMKLFKTIHGYQSGILFRKGITDEEVDIFLRDLIMRGDSNISFTDFVMTTTTAKKLIASAKRQEFRWHDSSSYSRPAFDLQMPFDEWKAGRKKIIKESDRLRRRLAEQGSLSWRILMPNEITEATIETFLSLEHDGWKGDESTSLLSRDQDAAFFRELASKLVDTGEVFFTELRLNDDTIASTVNFMSRSIAFAYKVAWNKKFARFSPGILNEISFIEYATSHKLPFTHIESGTNDGSFIGRLWPDRVSMFTGYLIGGPVTKHAASILWITSQLKKALAQIRLR